MPHERHGQLELGNSTDSPGSQYLQHTLCLLAIGTQCRGRDQAEHDEHDDEEATTTMMSNAEDICPTVQNSIYFRAEGNAL